MPSLKEIKGRIGSINKTLKITSAMKMVASAKLHKAQKAVGNLVPYEKQLHKILVNVLSSENSDNQFSEDRKIKNVALVCFSSNTSLCGAFNTNAIKKADGVIEEYRKNGIESVTVFAVGKKMEEAMKKRGFPSQGDYSDMTSHPEYGKAASLSEILAKGFLSGKYDKIELIYNHFHSVGSQPTVSEVFLPFSPENVGSGNVSETEYIIEPDRKEFLSKLLPKVLSLKIYTVLLDTVAAEHAARTVAMQTATDNAQDLLQELTLEYNKGRQQKITNELLDLQSV